jgi:hypothetical protein
MTFDEPKNRDLKGSSPPWVLWATIIFWAVFLFILSWLLVFWHYLGRMVHESSH